MTHPPEPMPCPFCGDRMTKTPSGVWRHESNVIDCLLIDIRFEDDSIPMWNKRPTPQEARNIYLLKVATPQSPTWLDAAAREIVANLNGQNWMEELPLSAIARCNEVKAILSRHAGGGDTGEKK